MKPKVYFDHGGELNGATYICIRSIHNVYMMGNIPDLQQVCAFLGLRYNTYIVIGRKQP